MKIQTGITAIVASAAVVSAAPSAIRQGSVARQVEKPAPPAPVLQPMYPSNCTITGQNCTKTPGGLPGHHGQPGQGKQEDEPKTQGGIFKFLGGLIKGLMGGEDKTEKRAEPVYVL